MAAGRGDWIGVEPETWFLVFERETPRAWVRWLACGRFKHVSALGYVRDVGAWVRYDVRLDGTIVQVMPDCQGVWDELRAISERGAVVLAMPRAVRPARIARVGFWCVPAMAHLVGMRGVFLRPDALFRACLRAGAWAV